MKQGIYKITNVVNNKCYVGSTINADRRWNGHKRALKKQIHCNRYLQRAWDKYGEQSFTFEIIENVLDKSRLIEREQYYLNTLKPEYCIRKIAVDSNAGLIWTTSSKKKLSKQRKGRKLSKIWKENISLSQTGKKHSEETKRKIGLAHKGIRLSEETKKKISIAKTGRLASEETKQKLSSLRKGRKPNNYGKTPKRFLNLKFDDDMLAEIRKLYAENKTINEISSMFNLPYWKTHRIINNITTYNKLHKSNRL